MSNKAVKSDAAGVPCDLWDCRLLEGTKSGLAALERQQGNPGQWCLPKKVCAVVLVWSSRREDIDVAEFPMINDQIDRPPPQAENPMISALF